ncbi:unnamed protein product, partial [Staurois parvus]
CHFFRLLTPAGVFHFFIGCWQNYGSSHFLLPGPNLPWAPEPPSTWRSARSRVSQGPCTAYPIAAVSIATLCCATSVLLTLLVCSILSIGCWQNTGFPLLLCQARNLPWAPEPL